MTSMDNAFVNQALEVAAKRMLTHLTGSEDTLKRLYLQPDRALFLAENQRIILKVYMAGTALQREYATAQKAASIGIPIPKMLGLEAGPPAVLAMKQVLAACRREQSKGLASRYSSTRVLTAEVEATQVSTGAGKTSLVMMRRLGCTHTVALALRPG